MNSALKKDENYYPQVPLKECKYIEKKEVRHINRNLSDSAYSDESDEEQIKAIRLMVFWENNFENAFFEGAILKSLMKNIFCLIQALKLLKLFQ